MKIKAQLIEKPSIGEQIKRQREASGITQLDLSQQLGYKTNAFYYLENGRREVTVGLLSELNKKFGWEFEVNNLKTK